jgi:type IV secretory pathway ATPase VirB11/archaellum biosynthesis ATPase
VPTASDPGHPLRLDDLVANGTITAAGADVLRGIGAGAHAFLVYSLPRNAGKSTVTEAILDEAPAHVARHDFLGTEEEAADLGARRPDGYLVVAEMGHRGRPGYLAGEEIHRAFALVAAGYPLASSLHADDVDGLVQVLADHGIDAPTIADGVRFLVKVQPLGDPFAPDTRRVVEHVDEVTGVDGDGRLATVRRYVASDIHGTNRPPRS